MGALFVPRQPVNWRSALSAPMRAPTVMTSPPTVTSGAIPTLTRMFYPASTSPFFNIASVPLGGVFTVSRTQPDATAAGYVLMPGQTLTNGTGGPTSRASMQVSFLHDGSVLELGILTAPYGVLVRVDGDYVSLTPPVIGAATYQRHDFGSRKLRRIDLIGGIWGLLSVGVGNGDGLYPAPVRGPRVICLGDSMSTINTDLWHTWFGDAMGWDDVWSSGVGGTGYINTVGGTKKTFRARLQSDVIPFRPDIVMVMGSVNDWTAPPAQVTSEAAALVAELRAALPNCLVVGSHACSGGVETLASNALDVMDAVRAGFAAAGGVWLNPVQMPLAFAGAVPSSLLSGAHAAGRPGNSGSPTTVATGQGILVDASSSTATNLRVGATVEIGSGATRERVHLTAFAQSGAKLLFGFDGALRYAHASGEPVVEVGPSFMTGRGKVGATTGWGLADTHISSDGVHPTAEGHRAIAMMQAHLLRTYLSAQR